MIWSFMVSEEHPETVLRRPNPRLTELNIYVYRHENSLANFGLAKWSSPFILEWISIDVDRILRMMDDGRCGTSSFWSIRQQEKIGGNLGLVLLFGPTLGV